MVVIATWITKQLVFNGVVAGLTTGLLAMGIVLVYRSTRVINFAVGNMGLVGASLLALLVVNFEVPFWLAAIGALVVGTLFGVVMELVVVRRLFYAPRVTMLVATIGIAGLAQAVITAYPHLKDDGASYPVPLSKTWDDVAGLRISGAQLAILVVVPIVAVALGVMLNRTTLGRTVKAAAENPDVVRVQGINPKVVSTAVWAIAGFLATLTMILIAGESGSASQLPVLGANTLARALVAAVIAGMVSFPRAMLAGVVIGAVESLVLFNFLDKPGLVDLFLLLAVLMAVAFQGRGHGRDETQTFSFTPKVREIPENLRDVWWVKRLNVLVLGVLLAAAVAVPLLITTPSRLLLYALIGCFAICALSLTVLTGWAGQLSLGQMAFAGIGALLAAALERGLQTGFIIDLHLDPLPFALSIIIAALLTAVVAVVVGAGSLRVRGLMLAVTTFVFAVAAQQYFYRQPLLSGGSASLVSFPRGTVFGINLASQRAYYWAVLAVLVVAVGFVSHLRRSGIGRTTIAVRDNADSAAAYTVGSTATKLRAFALAGGLAGLGGALIAGAVESVPFTERYFLVGDSLQLVSIVVIGGIASPMGAVVGALWVIGMPAFFPDNELVPLLTSSLGLLVLLLYFPGGFVQIAHSARDGLLAWASSKQRAGTNGASHHHTAGAATARARAARGQHPGARGRRPHGSLRRHRRRRRRIAQRRRRRDRRVDRHQRRREVDADERCRWIRAVRRHGAHSWCQRVAARSARRAREGLGRTFQAARLFPELTVRETVEVALEARGRTGFLSTALYLPHTTVRDRRQRSEADELIGFLGLGRYATVRISDLSTGTRRIVELAGLLALDARVLCLDEPTAGVAQRETEAFGPLIKEIRRSSALRC